jgi:hypothetical protein
VVISSGKSRYKLDEKLRAKWKQQERFEKPWLLSVGMPRK